ncbi:hypothetical protein FOZ60_004449 [Perkinsus olseni]|uniref:Cilia- and flagella-associated protein 58 central coiled coil domain-containing protein n=2 Tax=Perkinsus olseni TaxID=32597 RepID=A0A7J6PNU5_PEROL|nr:hypothetical protein FOZ60_004449 [Perkinsus olseni]
MGLTLPGMKDGYLLTREHVISTTGGQAAVKAHPSYPYQYLMTTSKAHFVTVEMLYNHKALTVASDYSPGPSLDDFGGATNLFEAGWQWKTVTVENNVLYNIWTKRSFDGIHPDTGANMSSMYIAGIAPDTWTLTMDRDNEIPVHLAATNERHDGALHQEMAFSQVERLPDDYTIEDGLSELYSTYQIDGFFHTADADAVAAAAPSLPDGVSDWASGRRLKEASGIPYFTIIPGSDEEVFFNSAGRRRLMLLFGFEFPHKCRKDGVSRKFCLFLSLAGSGFKTSFSASLGARFPDVNNPKRSASFALSVSFSWDTHNNFNLDLSLSASGCATVFQLGSGVSLTISICLSASGSIHNIHDKASRSISASIGMSVSISLNLPIIGSIVDVNLSGGLGCRAAADNTISAFGRIGVSSEIVVAGASIFLDINARTVDNLPNRWHFSSGVTFSAWLNLVIWKPRWNRRLVIWQIGPITFRKPPSGHSNHYHAWFGSRARRLESHIEDYKILQPFRVEYERLYKIMKDQNDNRSRLLKKCRELGAEIAANSSKVHSATKTKQANMRLLEELGKEKEALEKEIKASEERQRKESANMEALRKEAQQLRKQMKQFNEARDASLEEPGTTAFVISQMQVLREERKRLESLDDEIYSLERDNKECGDQMAALKLARDEKKRKLENLRESVNKIKATRKETEMKLAKKRSEIQRETQRRDESAKEVKEARLELSRVRQEREVVARELHDVEEELKEEEDGVRDLYREEERLERTYKLAINEKKKLDRELRREITKNDKIVKENVGKNIEMRIKTEETQSLSKAIKGMDKLIYLCQEKTDSLKTEVGRLEKENEEKKEKLTEQLAANQRSKRAFDTRRKRLEDLLRERDLLNKDVLKHAVELSEENAKYFAALEEVKIREGRIAEVEKLVGKAEAKLAQQQSLYDSVCADRNLYSKSLIDCNAEIEEIKKRSSRWPSTVATQKAEAKKLQVVVEDAEKEVSNHEKELKSVLSERDLLANQLSNREVEVRKLYEKIRLLESELRQGAASFNDLLKDRRSADKQLLDLRREIDEAKLHVAEGRTFIQQKMRLGKEIKAEVLKCSKLQQELERPMNVHRWRRLQSSDMQTFERLKRVRELQQRLIQAQEEVVKKEKEITAKESEFMSLKAALQKQPGPEIHDQILLLQQAVKDKQTQLTVLEMNMQEYRQQCHENSADVGRLRKQMKEMNDDFIEKSRESFPSRAPLLPSSDTNGEENVSPLGFLGGS